MKNDNKKFWNRFARFYGFFMKKSHNDYDAICRIALTYLRKDMKVLELACGSGQLSFTLADAVKRYDATDFSEEMIKRAELKNNRDNLYFAVEDATSLKYLDACFDAVVISNAMHILPEPEKVMDEIKRVLKPNGILIAPTFVWRDKVENSVRVNMLQKIGFIVYTKWTATDYIEYLRKHGYEELEYKIIGSASTPICCAIMKKK